MRTRILPKMLNQEIEKYLSKNDLIFIPVGTVETHGGLPLDSETVMAEALALRFAEETDGLCLERLPYFYAGATAVGCGTVNMGIKAGNAYLMELAHSLLKQGFRRQVYISHHGPSMQTIGPMIRDFFQETKVPIAYFDRSLNFRKYGWNVNSDDDLFDIFAGAYAILGRLEEIPLLVPESRSQKYCSYTMMEKGSDFAKRLFGMAHWSGAVGYYFDEPYEHVPTLVMHSWEELERHSRRGIEIIEKGLKLADMPGIVQSLKKLDFHMNEKVILENPHLTN